MTVEKQAGFWLAALLAFTLILFALSEILLPFVAGLALAYLLDPIADRLQRVGLGRLTATLVILVAFVLVFILILVLVAPLLASQLSTFITRLPALVARLQQLVIVEGAPFLADYVGAEAVAELERSFGDLVTQATGWLATFLRSLWAGGQAIVGVFALIVITPVVAFYLLVDWDRMVAAVDSWLPRPHHLTIRRLAREIDRAIAGFLRGQAIVCLLLGTFYAVGLTLVGLNFGVLIGMTAGLLSFIPYVGSLTGLVLSVGVAIVQFWPDWIWIVATLGVFVFGQFVEGNILAPYLVGQSVGLHPVWLMFALLAFGSLFGFVGLLLAVPLAAAIGVLARFALQRYLASRFYKGAGLTIVAPDRDG